MPRQPRFDAPATLQNVMGRGINEIKIFCATEGIGKISLNAKIDSHITSGEMTIYG